ncbi:hypothetical protein Hanom_Chr09g00871411 [Helianthus anomalus]
MSKSFASKRFESKVFASERYGSKRFGSRQFGSDRTVRVETVKDSNEFTLIPSHIGRILNSFS